MSVKQVGYGWPKWAWRLGRDPLLRLCYWVEAFREWPTWPLCRLCSWRVITADDCGWFCVGGPEEKPICHRCLMRNENLWGDR